MGVVKFRLCSTIKNPPSQNPGSAPVGGWVGNQFYPFSTASLKTPVFLSDTRTIELFLLNLCIVFIIFEFMYLLFLNLCI